MQTEPLDYYRVRPGDTLASIASGKEITLAGLLAVNPRIIDPNRINAGEVLALPYAELPPEAQLVHLPDGTIRVMTALDKTASLNATARKTEAAEAKSSDRSTEAAGNVPREAVHSEALERFLEHMVQRHPEFKGVAERMKKGHDSLSEPWMQPPWPPTVDPHTRRTYGEIYKYEYRRPPVRFRARGR
jgi:hypothetical protein